MLFIDLDHFKHLNDRFGHAKGDRALQVIAERIKTIIRPGDTAGRLGGDEFAILLEDVESIDVVETVCERLLDRPVASRSTSATSHRSSARASATR